MVGSDVNVYSNQSEGEFVIDAAATSEIAQVSATGGSSAPRCTVEPAREWVPDGYAMQWDGARQQIETPWLRPGLWVMVCDGTLASGVLLGTAAPSNPASVPEVPPREVVMRMLEEVELPDVGIRFAPPRFGIVQLPTWAWVTGWDGEPIMRSTVTPWGRRIDLEAQVLTYEWDWGDGTVVRTKSLGRPWPEERGAVTYTYETAQYRRCATPNCIAGEGYTVTVRAVFDARYRVDGGPWRDDVPGIERAASTTYSVHEIRSVVVRRS